VGTALGRPAVILCATPAYLKAHGTPAQPAELAQHAVLVPGQSVTQLRLHRGRQQAQVPLTPRLIVTDPAVVHAATAAGTGIGVLPEFLCRQGLAMGKLTRVLPEWQVADLLELYAVTDLRRAGSKAVQALIGFFIANMVPVLGKA
jgi:DNA-binding transcriptional LysR family regulator